MKAKNSLVILAVLGLVLMVVVGSVSALSSTDNQNSAGKAMPSPNAINKANYRAPFKGSAAGQASTGIAYQGPNGRVLSESQIEALRGQPKPAFLSDEQYDTLMENLPNMYGSGKGVFYGYDLDGNLFVKGKFRKGFFGGKTSEDKVLRGVYGSGILTGIYDGNTFNGEYENHFVYMEIDGKEIYGVYM